MMENEHKHDKPNYIAVIPSNVRYDKRLKANEKLLYSEITALISNIGYCEKNDSYFADLYNVSRKTISHWIKNLSDLGYIQLVTISEENNVVVNKRRIFVKK